MATETRANGRKPTAKEHAERVRRCREWLGTGHTSGEIKRLAAEEFGIVPRTAEGYLSRAREEIREELDQPIEEQRADAIAFYAGILTDESASHRDRIKARERIDKLLGLDAPSRTMEMSRMSEEQLREEARRLGIPENQWELPGGNPDPDPSLN